MKTIYHLWSDQPTIASSCLHIVLGMLQRLCQPPLFGNVTSSICTQSLVLRGGSNVQTIKFISFIRVMVNVMRTVFMNTVIYALGDYRFSITSRLWFSWIGSGVCGLELGGERVGY